MQVLRKVSLVWALLVLAAMFILMSESQSLSFTAFKDQAGCCSATPQSCAEDCQKSCCEASKPCCKKCGKDCCKQGKETCEAACCKGR
jgi:hypothetical protein